MRVLLDQNVPAGVRHLLVDHDVTTTKHLGWETIQNGDLIAKGEERGFEVLVTCDQNLRYQQNLDNRQMALVVLSTSRWADIRRSLDLFVAAIDRSVAGSFEEVAMTRRSRSL